MIKNITFNKNDDYTSPYDAWEFIFRYIKTDLVWCPFYCDGTLSQHLDKLQINYIHEDKDFFTYEPDMWNCVIDNPPYSIKKKIFERLDFLGKPYALLLPMDSLSSLFIADSLRDKDFTIIIPKKRFVMKEGRHSPPFKSIWVCKGFNLGKQVIFE